MYISEASDYHNQKLHSFFSVICFALILLGLLAKKKVFLSVFQILGQYYSIPSATGHLLPIESRLFYRYRWWHRLTYAKCLQMMDCFGAEKVNKLAEIVADTVLCGELTPGAIIVANE